MWVYSGTLSPLTVNTWTDGEITSSTTNGEIWYSFNVTSGTTYYLWWNDAYSSAGDGTKTLNIEVSAYLNNSTTPISYDLNGADTAWSTPRSFTASSDGTVKLKVLPYTSGRTGTFAITYNTNSTRPYIPTTVTFNINGGTGTTPTLSTVDYGSNTTLPDGSGFSRTDFDFLGWNTSSSGSGTTYSAGTSYTVTSNITLYAKWIYNGIGCEINPISLSEDTWADGETTSSIPELWYSFDVIDGTTYYVWWNDSDAGPTPKNKTMDIRVSASYSTGSSIFTGIDSGWTTPRSFTATSSGTVKLRVYPYGSVRATGTFGIVFSTNSTRPSN